MIFMHNPFAKPHTLEQWLPSSACWLITCATGWYACSALFRTWTGVPNGAMVALPLFSSFVVGHLLIWKKVIATGKALLDAEGFSALVVVLLSHLWMLLLLLFQVSGLLLVPLICLLTSFPTGSKGFVDFG